MRATTPPPGIQWTFFLSLPPLDASSAKEAFLAINATFGDGSKDGYGTLWDLATSLRQNQGGGSEIMRLFGATNSPVLAAPVVRVIELRRKARWGKRRSGLRLRLDKQGLVLTEDVHSLEQHSEAVVQGCTSPRHAVWGAAATNEAATATATKRVDLENCMLGSGWIEKGMMLRSTPALVTITTSSTKATLGRSKIKVISSFQKIPDRVPRGYHREFDEISSVGLRTTPVKTQALACNIEHRALSWVENPIGCQGYENSVDVAKFEPHPEDGSDAEFENDGGYV
ncbi:hypothetical protein FIBSPDRAFT_932670 [Athelia psychrophila]|uniref:Uncharacterized protein n=1 Tax=Athelia psychrophila TaxID=1759441 RepID=A0A166IES4_9AGAM|nr:hypothetical protein FIBSPDRAFT_932670 [Fibularhizoctonia sp. CBS 109695]